MTTSADAISVFHRFLPEDPRLRTGIGIRESNLIRVASEHKGTVIYGPYIHLHPGAYNALVHFDPGVECHGSAEMDVVSVSAGEVFGRKTVTADQIIAEGMIASIPFSSSDPILNLEVRLICQSSFSAAIRSVEISGSRMGSSPAASLTLSDLPTVHVENTVRRGRNLYDGYQRGICISSPNLVAKVMLDSDYQRAHELADKRTIVVETNLRNIFLLLKFYVPRLTMPAHIVEFGSFRGGSAIFMSSLAQKFMPNARVFAFDTFSGMPDTDRSVDFHQQGDFRKVDLIELRQYVEEIGLRNLTFVPGRFEDTASSALSEIRRIGLCHIDCDIRSAIECAYDSAKPYMVPGGYWVFDDPLTPTCLGATEAVEDLLIRRDGLSSEQVSPHWVFREPFWPDVR